MQIFIDSADATQIETWLRQGVVDGATTNPSIMFKDGVTDVHAGALRLSKLLGDRPLSVEVTTNHHETMLEQGRLFATWGRNIVIKIPIVNASAKPLKTWPPNNNIDSTEMNVSPAAITVLDNV